MTEQAARVDGYGRSWVSSRPWLAYLAAVATTFAAMMAAYGAVLVALGRTGHLPPPAIVNEVCADEKLEWLRDNPPQDPNLLVVGSSIAWRDVDSRAFVARDPASRPLNGGVCHLSVNQTRFVVRYLLRHFPAVRTVVAVVAPQDFTDCSKTPSRLFNPATADAYVFDRRWAYGFYVTQFDPVALVRDATAIRAMRDGRNKFDALVMTPYGDGPLRIEGNRGLLYGRLTGYDPTCFAAMRDLAQSVEAGGRRLFVASAPVNPAWSARYDPEGHEHGAMAAGVRAALQGTGAEFWDGTEAFGGSPREFTDAIHINWQAAQRYSALLAAALGQEPDQR